jgi:hypothetical protein
MCKMIYRTVSTCTPSCLTHNNQRVNTRDELVFRIMNSAAVIKQERQDDLRRELHVLLPTELKSALKSMVRFLNTYFELLQFI